MKTIPMPDYRTFANTAKAAMSGEFSERIEIACPDCDGEGEIDGRITCEKCEGFGIVWQAVPVTWSTIKAIYKRATELFGPQEEAQDTTP